MGRLTYNQLPLNGEDGEEKEDEGSEVGPGAKEHGESLVGYFNGVLFQGIQRWQETEECSVEDYDIACRQIDIYYPTSWENQGGIHQPAFCKDEPFDEACHEETSAKWKKGEKQDCQIEDYGGEEDD